ncbi:NADH-quinone oxidoreductase subunit NuoN [Bacillus sp. AGMB 02131]|uniref:NADH-quinone oxidoreductase subunit N n=1 Tax=Peribacillus faecalis TaxID=2772559 RepID=A0A927CZH7_9BACI|nr:NADH-quinone oxidoreductase subunit NuoN [Peribacillus faecalis]MBD3109497.1 NADH-quinone oxidoreductase subunit NuoN [Peribacillus faecalis]
MDIETLLSFNWGAMMPEFIILGVLTVLCIIDLLMPAKYSRRSLGWFAIAGVLVAIVSLLSLIPLETTSILYDTFRLDSFAKAFKLVLLFGMLLVLLLAESYRPGEGIEETRGEFYYLFLTALLGTMVMASSGDLITLFVGLELLSVSSYILAGIRKRHLQSNEAAMKYVINGSIATAITLFGMSYLYGLTGTTNLTEMGSMMEQMLNSQFQYLFGVAFFMMLVGFSFKIASAPFHMWAPDVYQGAPTPVTAFLSVISKAAGFIIMLRIIIFLYVEAPGDAVGAFDFMEINHVYIAVLAGVTMVIGNVVALRQSNIKRMLAYSSIAHAGYLLVSIATLGYFTSSIIWFYLVAYMLMNVGAFAIVQHMQEKTGSTEIDSYAGLYKSNPLLAVTMSIFLLSMAGIPGTAGFIGKMYIFIGTFSVNPSNYVLAATLIGTTVISYVYYIGVMKQMFFRPAFEQGNPNRGRIAPSLLIVLSICVLGTIIFGIIPGIALDFLGEFKQFDDFVE